MSTPSEEALKRARKLLRTWSARNIGAIGASSLMDLRLSIAAELDDVAEGKKYTYEVTDVDLDKKSITFGSVGPTHSIRPETLTERMLRERNRGLVEALKFYADENNHERFEKRIPEGSVYLYWYSKVDAEEGRLAREALKKWGGK